MRKKNGFTTIELITTFGLVMTITLLLFELVVSLKQIYINVGMRNLLLNKQAIIEKNIYDDLNNKKIKVASRCGTNCLTFVFDDNSYFEDLIIENITIPEVETGKNDSLLTIYIPISNSLLGSDYGVNIIYQYDSRETSIGDVIYDEE